MTRAALEGFGKGLEKTDEVDAGTLANLCAAGCLPEIRTPDAATERLRRLVARRCQVVRHRTRLKNELHAIPAAHLIAKRPHAELFNGRGRAWLARQPVPDDERVAIERHVRELDRPGEDLADLDRDIAKDALGDETIGRLVTITGVNIAVAAGLMAAIGHIERFAPPQKPASCSGLNPRVRQSGLGAAHHGRIEPRPAAAMPARCGSRRHGPRPRRRGGSRGFFIRLRAKRGHQIAAVAVARKLAVLCWHMLTKGEDYRWARPSLVAHKRRAMELAAGKPQKKGDARGPAYAYHAKELRHQKIEIAERAQESCEHFAAAWRPRASGRRSRTDDADTDRRAAASPRQGLTGPPGDAPSRRAALRHEIDRTTEG